MSAPMVPPELVQAAVEVARDRGCDVAEVPLGAVAAAAGISRATLFRRVGSRQALEDAVRAAGVDPGGRPAVRDRAVAAAAELIGEQGLGALTLEAVAARAGCSLPALHTAVGGRDGLLLQVFERYTPVPELPAVVAGLPAGTTLEERARLLYRTMLRGFRDEPRVLPALLADALGRPEGPAGKVAAEHLVPRVIGSVGHWLAGEMEAGRVRPLPLPLLLQQFAGPMIFHLLSRPLAGRVGIDLPPVEEAADTFAASFARAVGLDNSQPSDKHSRKHPPGRRPLKDAPRQRRPR